MMRYWKIIGGLLAVVVVGALATPKLLSTDYVKQRVASQLSSITGRTVVLNGDSAISLLPYLSVSYSDVRIGEANAQGEPLIKMDALRAKLRISSAFWGTASLAELDLIRPVVSLKIDQTGAANWLISKGPLAEGLQTPEGQPIPKLTLGELTFENGIVVIDNAQLRWTEEFTDVNGTLSWAELQAPTSVQGNAVWRGEVVSVDAQIASLFNILRGGTSELSANVVSKPITVRFDGSLSVTNQSSRGEIEITTPSAARLSTWLRQPLQALTLLGNVQLEGDIVAGRQKTEFSNMAISSGEHTGVGRLLINMPASGQPQLSGTLAFDTFSFPQFLQATNAAQSGESEIGEAFGQFFSGYELDMRLSANRAELGEHELANVAAAALVRDGNASLDIGQADIFGGTAVASLSVSAIGNAPSYTLATELTGADFSELAAVHGASSYSLQGRGNIKLNLKSTGKSVEEILMRLNGDGSLQSKAGSLNGLDLNAVLAESDKSSGQIWQPASGTTPYQSLELNLSVANGIALFDGSKLSATDLEATLSGKSDLVQRSLALRGQIVPKGDTEQAAVPFFIGGTTSAPLFAPLFGRKPPTAAKAVGTEN